MRASGFASWTRTFDQDVDDSAGAGLPAGQGRGVEDTDEGSDEVVGVGFGTEFAAYDGALDQSTEGTVDRTA